MVENIKVECDYCAGRCIVIVFTKKFKIDNPESVCVSVCVCLCVCLSVCVCVCVSLASDSSETIKDIIIKLGMVTVSDMRIHHVLILLTLTNIQGLTDINHENNKCSIISETKYGLLTEGCSPTRSSLPSSNPTRFFTHLEVL